jgi:peptidylprolyl isomerase
MSQAKSGDTVKIHYTGTLDDGTEFDSSAGREPLEFEVGGGQVIPGFDNAVEGMAVGDKKSASRYRVAHYLTT